ncbi:MAG TPA: hypothetical protein ENN61_03005 [Bacteroidaceae bacterium]|nr:hypothetical protein [Bacteroidaceae bacterium]
MPSQNELLSLFRFEVSLLLEQYRGRMLLMIAKNKKLGIPAKTLRSMREDPKSKWNLDKEALNKKIKGAVAGIVNQVHIEGYQQGLRK